MKSNYDARIDSTLSLQQVLQKAILAHQLGDLTIAEGLYKVILELLSI